MLKVVRGGSTFELAGLTPSSTVLELKAAIARKTGLHPHRQNLSISASSTAAGAPAAAPSAGAGARLDDNARTLAEAGLGGKQGGLREATLLVKDYGPQISYRLVFLIEYAGPLLIMAAYATRPALLFGAAAARATWSPVAWWGVVAWLLHFAKREAETLFVHKFSRPTMPLRQLFVNCAYYWFFAFVVGWPLCHPAYSPPASAAQVAAGAALMAAAELVNLAVHLQLGGMRPAELSKKRDAPGGPLFALVSCPNYTAEVLGWVGFSIMTQVAASAIFTALGLYQMSVWALQKHRGYLKADPDYKKLRRAAIIPFLL